MSEKVELVEEKDEGTYISEIENELRQIYQAEDADPSLGPLDWLLGAVGLVIATVWFLFRYAIPILILVGIVAAITGVFDKEEVREDRASPGWTLVRELRDEGAIGEFKAVEPDEGWQWQYELDSSTDLRFRRVAGGTDMEYMTRSSELEEAIKAAAQRHGYVEE